MDQRSYLQNGRWFPPKVGTVMLPYEINITDMDGLPALHRGVACVHYVRRGRMVEVAQAFDRMTGIRLQHWVLWQFASGLDRLAAKHVEQNEQTNRNPVNLELLLGDYRDPNYTKGT